MLSASEPASLFPASADHGLALQEGHRLAAFTGRSAGSADLLIGLLRAGGAAARLLGERGMSAPRLEALLAQVRLEPAFDVDKIARSSHEIARNLGARQTSSLHLMLALLRAGGSAVDLLRLSGTDPARVRTMILRALTGPARFGERAVPRGKIEPAAPPAAPPPRVEAPVAVATPAAPWEGGAELDLQPLEAPRTPVLHRDRELGRLLDLMETQGSAKIVCVQGDPGSGRSVLLAALAAATPIKPMMPAAGLPPGQMPAAVLAQLHRLAPAGVAIVLDDRLWLAGEAPDAPAQLLATARAGRRWILTATPAERRRYETLFPDLVSAMETVQLAPLAPDALLEILETGLEALAQESGLDFTADLYKALLRLASRYPADRSQPGRSLRIAEIAAGRALRLGRPCLTETEVAEVVADAADVPLGRLLRSDDERFRTLESRLAERVFGHDEERGRIAGALRRSYAGFRGRRPLASLLLLGPTGVGKTETSRAIADALYDGESALVRIDLSEYNESHAVARLIGSPPGYVGFEDGGQLTEAVRRRPACVVLLDELEKAHRDVLLTLLQVLEDGRLTDGRGRTVDFSSSVIVMTSNLGSECYRRSRNPAQSTILGVARSRLPPELWNRIDEVLCYAPLKEQDLRAILERVASDSSARLEAERDICFRVDDSVIDHVLGAETDRTLGARPLRRAFERLVEGPLATEIVSGNIRRGARLVLAVDRAGELTFRIDR